MTREEAEKLIADAAEMEIGAVSYVMNPDEWLQLLSLARLGRKVAYPSEAELIAAWKAYNYHSGVRTNEKRIRAAFLALKESDND